MEYYWELILKDGDVIEIPPAGAPVVQKRMGNKDPINLRTRTIPFSEIKAFQQTSKPFGQPLLEAAAQAFDEPMEFEVDGLLGKETVLEGKWVKKRVTNSEYTNHYSKIPAYRSLGSEGGMAVVAFMLPIHQIDLSEQSYCTDDEVKKLTK